MGIMTKVALRKKLAVSMGVELTFLPAVFERLWQEQQIQPNDCSGENSMRQGYAAILRNVLHKRGISVYNCGTDPGCIEVPTNPRSTANSLMKDIQRVYSAARSVDLIPRADYIAAGGGAHLHTGLPEGVDEEVYRRLMQVWACNNPWMAWAFADKSDRHNASAIPREDLISKGSELDRQREQAECYRAQVAEYGDLILQTEKRLHTAEIWGDDWERRHVTRYLKSYIDERRSYMAQLKDVNKLIESLSKVADDKVCVLSIQPRTGKGVFLSSRGNTMEFRCFLMTEYTTGMRKHIALADEIVRKVTKQASNAPEFIPNDFGYNKAQLSAMKYSEAKRGFNNMLEELGLPVAAYREYCVNIALRMRWFRKNSVRSMGRY